MLVPNRNYSSPAYRYGFQGQEKDDEIKGSGNSLNYKYRMYDPRVGRFFAVDPLTAKYPWYSPYHFSSNNPIFDIELEGLESRTLINENEKKKLQEENGKVKYWLAERFLDFLDFNYNVHQIANGNPIMKYPVSDPDFMEKSLEGQKTLMIVGVEAYGLNSMTRGKIKNNRSYQKRKPVVNVSNTVEVEKKATINQPIKFFPKVSTNAIVMPNGKTRLGPNVSPQRYQGPWTKRDLERAAKGKGPLDLVPTMTKSNKPRSLELHHADNMPGSAIHEVPPSHTKTIWHQKNNQGVTNKMRAQDTKLHWQMRGQEMGNPPPPSKNKLPMK